MLHSNEMIHFFLVSSFLLLYLLKNKFDSYELFLFDKFFRIALLEF
jgi:hypothetical protein